MSRNVLSRELKNEIVKFEHDLRQSILPKCFDEFDDFQDYCIHHDAALVLISLKAIFYTGQTLEKVKQQFLVNCLKRRAETKGTSLSFEAAPKNVINRLYFNICCYLFNPSNMYELFAILFADDLSATQIFLELDFYSDSNIGTNNKSIHLYFSQNDFKSYLKSMPCPASLDAVSTFIYSGHVCFAMGNIENLDFKQHVAFYEMVAAYSQTLFKNIYTYNSSTVQLKLDVEIYLSKGISFRESLTRFSRDLLLGGEGLSGESTALPISEKACGNFRLYLDLLDEKNRACLLKLQNQSYSVCRILADLDEGGCVETAASNINAIIGDPNNQEILKTMPSISYQNQSLAMMQKYPGRGKAVFSLEDRSQFLLPSILLKKAFSKLNFNNNNQLETFLIHLPIENYQDLFEIVNFDLINTYLCRKTKKSNKCFYIFQSLLNSNYFTTAQKDALLSAMYQNINRFGGFSNDAFQILPTFFIFCLEQFPKLDWANFSQAIIFHLKSFAEYSHDPERFILLFKNLTSEERINFAYQNVVSGLLYPYFTDNPAYLEKFLSLLPINKLNQFLDYENICKFLAKPEFIVTIFKFLMDAGYDLHQSIKNASEYSLLYLTKYDIELSKKLLLSLPEKSRVLELKKPTPDTQSLISEVWKTSQYVNEIMSLIPKPMRISIFLEGISLSDLSSYAKTNQADFSTLLENLIFCSTDVELIFRKAQKKSNHQERNFLENLATVELSASDSCQLAMMFVNSYIAHGRLCEFLENHQSVIELLMANAYRSNVSISVLSQTRFFGGMQQGQYNLSSSVISNVDAGHPFKRLKI